MMIPHALICIAFLSSAYIGKSEGQDLVLNIEPDVVILDTNTNITSFEISCRVSERILTDTNLVKLAIHRDEVNVLTIEMNETSRTPFIFKSGIFRTAMINENATVDAFIDGEPFIRAIFQNVTFFNHIGLYRCEAILNSTVGAVAGNTTNMVTWNVTSLLIALRKPQIRVEVDDITKSGIIDIICNLVSPCLPENTVQVLKDGDLYFEIDNDIVGQDEDYLCQLSPRQTESSYNVTEADPGTDITFICEAQYTLPDDQILTLQSDVKTIAIEPTHGNTCKSSNDCLLHEICLLDFCNSSKCSCDEKHFYNGITCVSKKNIGEECEKCYECSTWLSVCDKHRDKPFKMCTCRQGYFYDAVTNSCTNIEPCPADNSFIFSRKDNVCYSVNINNYDNYTNWSDACKQNDSEPLKFVGNIQEHMIDRLWSYGFYSSNNAVDLDKNEEVMLLLSTSFNSSNKGSKSTWYWSDGEEISIDDIDNTEWNDVSDNAENTGCLYMLYDSCNSKVKTSTQCPLEKIHRGCLIKLPHAYCNEDIDERNTTWEFTQGGTILEKNCTTGYIGTVTRECTIYGEFKAPFYNCTLALFKNVSDMLVDGMVGVPEALAAVSSEVEHVDDIYIGDLIEIQNILGAVVNLSENVTLSENTTKDYLATASFLLDNEKNGKEWNSRLDNKGKGAEDVLPYVEHFAQQVAESMIKSNKSSLRLTQPNIVLQYAAVDTNENDVKDISFPTNLNKNAEWKDTKTLALSLDVAAFSGQSVKAFTCLLYRNLSQSIPKTLRGQSNTSKVDINSQVVSFQLLPVAPKTLNPELELLFHGFKDMTSKEQHCSYMAKDSSGEGLWSTSGCRKIAGNKTVVKCKCNHLTNFALLISPYKPPEKDASILGIITIIGSTISGIFILITLAVHIRYWRLMKSDKTILTAALCIMFIVCYILFLAGVAQTSNRTVCTGIAVTLHYVFLVLFFLMFAEGATVFITVTFPFHRKSHIKELLIIAFVVPLITTVAVAAGSQLEGYGNENNCWLTQGTWLFWMFAGPAAIVILANFVTVGLFFRRLFGTKASHLKSVKEKAKMTTVAIGILTPVMGLTWVFGFFSVNKETMWLQYIFCLFNSFQGVLIFLFHCVGNKQLRQAMKVSKERKRTVEDLNSELKDKIKRKFGSHSHTTTETNFSTVHDKDNTDGKINKYNRGILTTSENEDPASAEGQKLDILKKSVQTELKEKLNKEFEKHLYNAKSSSPDIVCPDIEDNTDDEINKYTRENEDPAPEGEKLDILPKSVQSELQEKLTEMFHVQDVNKSESCDLTTNQKADSSNNEVVSGTKAEISDIASTSPYAAQESDAVYMEENDNATEIKPSQSTSEDVQTITDTVLFDTTSTRSDDRPGSIGSQLDTEDDDKLLHLTLNANQAEDKNIETDGENLNKNSMLKVEENEVARSNISELHSDNASTNESNGSVLSNTTNDDKVLIAEDSSEMTSNDAAKLGEDVKIRSASPIETLETNISAAENEKKLDDTNQMSESSDSSEMTQSESDIQSAKLDEDVKIRSASPIETLETDISAAENEKKLDDTNQMSESSDSSEMTQSKSDIQEGDST